MMNRDRFTFAHVCSGLLTAVLVSATAGSLSATAGSLSATAGLPAKEPLRTRTTGQESEPTKTILLGHPANWEARFLRGSLTRQGHQFMAKRLTSEMTEEEYQAAIQAIMDELEATDTLIIHEANLRAETSFPLQAAIAERVRAGDTKLVFLATGAKDELAGQEELEPEFAALCPVTDYEREEEEDRFTSCFIEIENHPVNFESASLLRDLQLLEDTKVVTRIIVDDETYPWIVRRELGDGSVTFVASDDLWRIRGNSTRAYEKVWQSLIK